VVQLNKMILGEMLGNTSAALNLKHSLPFMQVLFASAH
jgi:hypothetical protein